eukprot:Gb_14063 [translate_table: standard]
MPSHSENSATKVRIPTQQVKETRASQPPNMASSSAPTETPQEADYTTPVKAPQEAEYIPPVKGPHQEADYITPLKASQEANYITPVKGPQEADHITPVKASQEAACITPIKGLESQQNIAFVTPQDPKHRIPNPAESAISRPGTPYPYIKSGGAGLFRILDNGLRYLMRAKYASPISRFRFARSDKREEKGEGGETPKFKR